MIRAFFAALLLGLCFGAHGGPLDRDFQKLEGALRLDPVQKRQFDVAVAATQRALLAVAMSGMQIQERMRAEMEKPRPDLNLLYDIQEQVIEQNKPLFREAREEWSRLYAMLDEDQVRIAKRYIQERLDLLLR
jgi:hypothetical protein